MDGARWFHINGNDFEVPVGSPTWERLIAEGHEPGPAPDGVDVVVVEPASPAKAPTKKELAALATKLSVPFDSKANVAQLTAAIETKRAELVDEADLLDVAVDGLSTVELALAVEARRAEVNS